MLPQPVPSPANRGKRKLVDRLKRRSSLHRLRLVCLLASRFRLGRKRTPRAQDIRPRLPRASFRLASLPCFLVSLPSRVSRRSPWRPAQGGKIRGASRSAFGRTSSGLIRGCSRGYTRSDSDAFVPIRGSPTRSGSDARPGEPQMLPAHRRTRLLPEPSGQTGVGFVPFEAGSVRKNSVPRPAALSTRTSPLWA